jgi:hypothetical protein
MLFSATLACAQLLWLVQKYISLLSSSACVAIVFALQYILLASLSSTTSIAFHSFLTFYNISKGKLARSNSAKSFVYYALYSFGIPLYFLLTCLLLYYNNLITITEKYPGNCWFTQDISAYISFSIPGLTMLLANFILLSRTMFILRECTNERRNLAEKDDAPTRIQIGIYLRMSTIMGSSWLFALLVIAFPRIMAFHYLFVFATGPPRIASCAPQLAILGGRRNENGAPIPFIVCWYYALILCLYYICFTNHESGAN